MFYKFKAFASHYCAKPQELFCQSYTAPLLLIEKQGETGLGSGSTLLETTGTATISLNGRSLGEAPTGRAIVFDFGKASQKQKFLISVGRGDNNSICLKDKSVSKFHAYFRLNASGQWEIADAGSGNGTMLNGTNLEAKKDYVLSESDGICFAYIYWCTFFSPEKFYEYIISLK